MNTLADERNHNFTMIDNEIITHFKLTPYELCIYVVLLSYMNRKTGVAFPGYGELAEISGMSVPSVKRAVAGLLESKLITKKNRFRGERYFSNEYTFTSVKAMVSQTIGVVSQTIPSVLTDHTLWSTGTDPMVSQTIGMVSQTSEQESLTRINRERGNKPPVAQGSTASPPVENLLKKRLQERGNPS